MLGFQGGAEKLSDEDIEATLEKVIKLLAFISDKVPSFCQEHAGCAMWLDEPQAAFVKGATMTALMLCFYRCNCSGFTSRTPIVIFSAHRGAHALVRVQDLFAEFYRKRLSRRLLVEKSSAEHHERAVLAQLKQQCGAQFTSKVPMTAACP